MFRHVLDTVFLWSVKLSFTVQLLQIGIQRCRISALDFVGLFYLFMQGKVYGVIWPKRLLRWLRIKPKKYNDILMLKQFFKIFNSNLPKKDQQCWSKSLEYILSLLLSTVLVYYATA